VREVLPKPAGSGGLGHGELRIGEEKWLSWQALVCRLVVLWFSDRFYGETVMGFKKTLVRFGLAGLVLACAFTSARADFDTGPFHGIGQNAGPGYIITVNADGSVTVTNNHLASYDTGGDDTYIGVVNNSAFALTSLTITSNLAIFGFDGDGITSTSPLVTGTPFGADHGGVPWQNATGGTDTTGYAGPNVSFININGAQTSGTVVFGAGGVRGGGGHAYFGLEDDINAANGTLNVPQITGTPEPTSLTLAGLGALGYLGFRRLRRKKQAKI